MLKPELVLEPELMLEPELVLEQESEKKIKHCNSLEGFCGNHAFICFTLI